jgi:hypothetical protein
MVMVRSIGVVWSRLKRHLFSTFPELEPCETFSSPVSALHRVGDVRLQRGHVEGEITLEELAAPD